MTAFESIYSQSPPSFLQLKEVFSVTEQLHALRNDRSEAKLSDGLLELDHDMVIISSKSGREMGLMRWNMSDLSGRRYGCGLDQHINECLPFKT